MSARDESKESATPNPPAQPSPPGGPPPPLPARPAPPPLPDGPKPAPARPWVRRPATLVAAGVLLLVTIPLAILYVSNFTWGGLLAGAGVGALAGAAGGAAVGLAAGKARAKAGLGPLPLHAYAADPATLRREFLG